MDAHRKALRAISSDYGIITYLMKMPILNGDPKLVSYGVGASNLQVLVGMDYTPLSAGCSPKKNSAAIAAIGETIERYCCAFFDPKDSIYGSYHDHKASYSLISPDKFSLFHSEQFQDPIFSSVISPFTDQVKLTWSKAFNLTKGEVQYIPSQFVYLPFNQDKKQVTIGVSTGLCAHSNFYKAILGGLYEAVERDAFAISWLQGLYKNKIILSPSIREYISQLYPNEYEWHLFDITTDIGIPTVFGFCIGKSEFGDFVAAGAATRDTFAAAIKKTIVEIGQSIPSFRHFLLERNEQEFHPEDFNSLNSFEDHSHFYLVSTKVRDMLKGWIEAKEAKNINLDENTRFDSIRNELHWALSQMSTSGCEVIVKDITTVDARQLGFYVVKVFSPQLIPLSGSYRFYAKGGNRLYSVPSKLGYISKDFSSLIPYPHPFP